MARGELGGTQKWCPRCKELTVCRAISPVQLGAESGQRFFKVNHPDIQWFRRALICQTCSNKWLTAEAPEELLDELEKLRDAVQEVKRNAAAYLSESQKASQLLVELIASLSEAEKL